MKQYSEYSVFRNSNVDVLSFERVDERTARKLAASGRGVYFFPCKPESSRMEGYIVGNLPFRVWKERIATYKEKFADGGMPYNVQFWKLLRYVPNAFVHGAVVPENPEEWGFREFSRVMRRVVWYYDESTEILNHSRKYANSYTPAFVEAARKTYGGVTWYLKQLSKRFPDYFPKWEEVEGRNLEYYAHI